MDNEANNQYYPDSGFDAYETAWDIVSKNLWRVLGYNLVWFAYFMLAIISFLILFVLVLENWTAFFTTSVLVLLILLPLWEGSNILRYWSDGRFPQQSSGLPVVRIVFARLLFLLIVAPGYIMFLLPGIYLHSRLSLYLPVLLRSPSVSPLQSLSLSWRLSRSRFVRLYTLWIVIVVSHPVSLLPFGFGLIFRQPLNGLAKDLMFLSCSNRPRDGPDQVCAQPESKK